MKRFYLPVPALVLAIFAAFIAAGSQSLHARDNNLIFAATAANGGHLVIKRSPVLGDNVSVTVTIDGKPAGTVRRGGAFESHLTPGRHELMVSPNRLGTPWRTTLDVRAGQTYSYVASYSVNKFVLTRVSTTR